MKVNGVSVHGFTNFLINVKPCTLTLLNSYYGQNPVISTKEAKGIIEIECAGNEGSDWKEIPLEKFNTYRIDDPTHLAAMNFTNWGYSTVSFSSLPVEVNWKAIDGFDNVDDHIDPWKKPIHGKRIFPDFKNPSDTEIRHKLEVIVKTSPALFGKTVYVKSFDIDDSTSKDFDLDENGAAPVIDTNGKAGGDNLTDYLNTPQNGQFWTGSAWGDHTAQGTVDANGETKFIFRVGMQPGSNYRVVASVIDEAMYAGVQTNNPAAPKYLGPEVNQNGGAAASPLLTVWRRLWVENDSMTAISTDSFGYKRNDLSHDLETPIIITKLSNGINTSFGISTISDQSSFSNLENGRLIVHSVEHPVIGTSFFGNTHFVQIAGDWSSVLLGAEFRLYDDDDYGLGAAPLPKIDLAGSFMKSLFASSFIETKDAGQFNTRPTLPFVINDKLHPDLTTTNSSKDLIDEETLWVSLITTAYQPDLGNDADPNEEGSALEGVTRPSPSLFPSYEHSTVFVEACRDQISFDYTLRLPASSRLEVKQKILDRLNLYIIGIATHEIGHQPGNGDEADDHAEMGLMARGGGVSPNNPSEAGFSAKTVLRFRKAHTWTKK